MRFNGRLIAQDAIADATTFELPGDTAYEVQIRKAAGGEIARTIKLTAEPDQIVEVR